MTHTHWRRWYPRPWRARYGEEYQQLLDDLQSQEQLSWRTELDIVQSGLSLRRSYPTGRRRHLIAAVSMILAMVLGLGLGLGLQSSGSSENPFAVLPIGRIAIRHCPSLSPGIQRLPYKRAIRVTLICPNRLPPFQIVLPSRRLNT